MDDIENIVNHNIERLKSISNDKWTLNYISNHKFKIRMIDDLKIITKNISPGSTILDLGAAPFILTKSLQDLGFYVLGVDLNPERFDYLDYFNLKVKKQNIENSLDLTTEFFDAVIFNEVFEHCRFNLIFTMSEIYRIIKNDGLLIMTTPNAQSIQGIYNYLFKGKICSSACDLYNEWNKINYIGHMGHVREYTEKEISEFMQHIGFNVRDVHYKGSFSLSIFNVLALYKRFKPNMCFVLKK